MSAITMQSDEIENPTTPLRLREHYHAGRITEAQIIEGYMMPENLARELITDKVGIFNDDYRGHGYRRQKPARGQ